MKWTNHIKVPIVESRFARDMVVEETCQSVRMGWDWTGQAKRGLKGVKRGKDNKKIVKRWQDNTYLTYIQHVFNS